MADRPDTDAVDPQSREAFRGAEARVPELKTPHSEGQKKHTIRWLALCLAGALIVASLLLVVELRQGLPLEFGPTMLLAVLAGFGLPALIVILAGRRLKAFGLDGMRVWCLVCALEIAACLLIILL